MPRPDPFPVSGAVPGPGVMEGAGGTAFAAGAGGDDVVLDAFDRRLLNRLQHGLPLVRHPWEAVATELGVTPDALRERVGGLLDAGVLTRFGPMFDIEALGGAFTLAALAVPEDRFDAVAGLLAAMPQVAHNYRRDHAWNMWFVLACDAPPGIDAAIGEIERSTGLRVLNLPKERTYHVGLHLPV